jgi:hypothetical protein
MTTDNNEFDMEAALADVSSGLGLGEEEQGGNDDSTLEVDPPAQEPANEVPAPEVPEASAPEAPATEDPLAKPPQTWKKEVAEKWAALPPEVRAEVQRREADFFKGIEQYKETASLGKSVQSVLAPYSDALRQHNIDPVQQISGLMRAHFTLARGNPTEKVALFQRLASDYGVDLGQIGAEPAYVDPAVQGLQSQLQAVTSQLSQMTERQQAEARATAERQLETFASDPANPHFEAVASDMAKLISTGVATDLKDAYDKAVWANPQTRQLEISRQQAEAVEKARVAAANRAAEARKATAANLRTSSKQGNPRTTTGTMDDTLNAALEEIKSRG